MFSIKIRDDLELGLLEQRHAEELFALVDQNREYLDYGEFIYGCPLSLKGGLLITHPLLKVLSASFNKLEPSRYRGLFLSERLESERSGSKFSRRILSTALGMST